MNNDHNSLGYIEDRYGDGECGVFAQALHGMTGLPLVLFRIEGDAHGPALPHSFPRHAAVWMGDDRYLDAFGASTFAETSARFGVRLTVDHVPKKEAYPFGSAPGQGGHVPDEFSEAEAHALEMLFLRGEDVLVSDDDVARVAVADEREALTEMPAVLERLSRRSAAGQLAHRSPTP
ncbi:hypothetical protein O9X98_04280 [Agrobacterium salinitolerans]|nr:hypothetical protein [Agrobacterium salinitolerans]